MSLHGMCGGEVEGSKNADMCNRLELNNCNFTGSLPAQWASGLPALQHINISSNMLTGAFFSALLNLGIWGSQHR